MAVDDKLEWSWEARDNKMIVIVRKADWESITKAKITKAKPRRKR